MAESDDSKRLIAGIMVAVAVWGAVLAFGAWWRFGNNDVWRAVVVGGCVAAFLGFWGAMLAVRAGRMKRR